jgi:hypothetical protein
MHFNLRTTDGISNSLSAAEKTALTLSTSVVGDGYAGVIDPGVQVGWAPAFRR